MGHLVNCIFRFLPCVLEWKFFVKNELITLIMPLESTLRTVSISGVVLEICGNFAPRFGCSAQTKAWLCVFYTAGDGDIDFTTIQSLKIHKVSNRERSVQTLKIWPWNFTPWVNFMVKSFIGLQALHCHKRNITVAGNMKTCI